MKNGDELENYDALIFLCATLTSHDYNFPSEINNYEVYKEQNYTRVASTRSDKKVNVHSIFDIRLRRYHLSHH